MMKTMFGLTACARPGRPKPIPANASELAALDWTNRRREIKSRRVMYRSLGSFSHNPRMTADHEDDSIALSYAEAEGKRSRRLLRCRSQLVARSGGSRFD